MRRYPRGVSKWRAHGFLPELAPTLLLVHWYHEQKNAIEARWRNTDPERFATEIAGFWRVYSRRYLSEMRRQRSLIEWLSALERDFGLTLTLLCACDDHRLCHRSLLADLIVKSPSPKPRS